MHPILAVTLLVSGIALVLFCAGRLVKGAIATARSFGLSAFLITVVFSGFDPENLAIGAAGTAGSITGIVLGSIIGAAMVAIALALGITSLFAPLKFERAPRAILALPVLAVVLFGVLSLDGAFPGSTACSCLRVMSLLFS